MSSSPQRRTIRASNVRLNRVTHPVIIVIVTQPSAANAPSSAAVDLVRRIRSTPYDRDAVLVVTATQRALAHIEDAAQLEGMNVSNLPVAVKYTRLAGTGRLQREVLKGTNAILAALPLASATPFASAATSPASSAGSPRTSGLQGTVPVNAEVITNRRRDGALYTVFRTALGGKGSQKRRLAALLVTNGVNTNSADVGEFVYYLNELKAVIKDTIGAFAQLPPKNTKKTLTPADHTMIATTLATEYARARGRPFVILMAYASGNDPKTGWANKKMRNVYVCYTPKSLERLMLRGRNSFFE